MKSYSVNHTHQPQEEDDPCSLEQMAAVNHLSGPIVVFSGAGSGKTRVIVHRIAKLIEEHRIHPAAICALTFTNKAALEMKERALVLTPKARHCLISTFHSASARWLREFGDYLGFDGQFSILDSKESDSLIKKILQKLEARMMSGEEEVIESLEKPWEEKEEQFSLRDYRQFIQKLKSQALTPNLPYTRVYCQEHGPSFVFEVYKAYQRLLKSSNSMDFADLLLHILTLLKTEKDVKAKLQNRYQYFLVDEYQDVNPAQFEMISHLVGPPHNLMVVGDDDQSIYSWRGADPRNILNFQKSYPEAKVIHLEQNYRSSGTIIQVASHLIGHNETRVAKKLWTANPAGEIIEHYSMENGTQEAMKICQMIGEEREQFALADIAVFYRTNAQSREVEDALLAYNLPYKIYGSLRFYDRAEIKDLLAYMRLAINAKDDVAFLRVIKAPSRGIGAKSMTVLANIADEHQLSLYEALHLIHDQQGANLATILSPGLIKKFSALAQELHQVCNAIANDSLDQVVGTILGHIDYHQYLKKVYKDQAEDKLENVTELSAAMAAYLEQHPHGQLKEWVQDISLAGSEQEGVKGVSLMTLHAAKGLEFKRVYIVGCDDGLLPHSNSLASPQKIEEERRLFYVGLTRAMVKLTLMSATERRGFYEWKVYRKSRFMKELPSKLIISHKVDYLPNVTKGISLMNRL
ncbi:MAG: UvrD-helicase domain-containing protein [Proteobacteria bacterium]|nr:UvrD-helicase domain-containing protein [Pseudomonadota bacterium]